MDQSRNMFFNRNSAEVAACGADVVTAEESTAHAQLVLLEWHLRSNRLGISAPAFSKR
jgi:hypothetical protein